ncbi:MAG: pantoate--beta-alanine ligase [Bdellovibrionota bacterium]|nr:pantoate--beta-alanine ligase [Bdellovibrionota bacterium]
MKTVNSVKEMLDHPPQKSRAFIPTMGALHQGHLSLIEAAKENHDEVVVSIFVNPTQFNQKTDLENYPRDLDSDKEKLKSLGVDILFLPTFEQMYPDNYHYKITENEFSKLLCGAHRPGHFDGVLSIVMKLFNIVKPREAFFGEKDYQQFQLLKAMVEAFFMDLKITSVKTKREESGLAMSSRNLLLSTKEKELAPELYKNLSDTSLSSIEIRKNLESKGFQLEYLEEIDGRRYIAAHLGKVRLIDNVSI